MDKSRALFESARRMIDLGSRLAFLAESLFDIFIMHDTDILAVYMALTAF